MKTLILIITLTALATTAGFSQTATPMAQYAGNQLIFNPGFAGAHDLFSVNLSYRTLWVGVPHSPTLVSFNLHGPFTQHEMRHSAGLTFQRETFGPQFVNTAYGTYSHKIRTGHESFLSLGIQAGLFNSVTDWSMVDFVMHEEDPAYGHNERWKSNKFDANLGAHFQAENFYIGVSARHLSAPRFDEIFDQSGDNWHSRVRRQFFVMGGYNFIVNNDFDVRPRMLMRYKPTVPLAISTGVDVVYHDRFSLGANFMTGQNAVTLMATGEIVEGLRIGYAFDMIFGALQNFQKGSHEIFVSYFMPIRHRINAPTTRQPFR